MAYAYLARYYSPGGDCGTVCIHKEGIFRSLEEAEAFVSENVKEEIEEPPPETERSATAGWWSSSTAEALSASARYEIVEFEIGSHNAAETARTWLYDGAGRFVRLEDNGDETEQQWTPDPASYEGKYQPGDVVFVRACLWNPYSHFDRDIIGVIAWRPLPLREWLERGEKEDEWGGVYMVDFIGTDGYPDHDHVEEPGIQPFEGDIPENLGFLLTLSDHYRGKRTIKQSVFDELFAGKIFVERVRTFTEDDFER